MADHSLPTQTSGYINFVQQMDYRFDDLARGLDPAKSPVGDPTISNLPVDSVGWSSENSNWRKWTGSIWEPLALAYAIDISGNAATVTNGVYTTGTQTISGSKTFNSIITGSISGNAGTVTNGVYTSGDQTIAGSKTFSSTILGSVSGNAGTVTNGVYTTGAQTITGSKTFSSQIIGSISGNAGTAGTAVKLSTTKADWSTNGVITSVVGLLSWKNYGNGHVIFDASAGTSPDGTTVNSSNPANNWSSSYPTLMGWNGSTTYGVRVDVARYAETANTAVSATTAVTATNTTNATNATYAGTLATTNWTVFQSGSSLYFQYAGVSKMRLDYNGDLVVAGSVTAGGSV